MLRFGTPFAVVAGLVLGCSGFAPDAAAQTRIRLGVIGPLTGDFAFGGEFQLNGARLKAAELNARKEGITVELLAEDDQSKCDVAVAAARKLITRDKVDAILGAWQSTCTLAIRSRPRPGFRSSRPVSRRASPRRARDGSSVSPFQPGS